VLRLTDARKAFGPIVAVDRLTLAVGRGEVLGLLGPNGAGKSTTVALAVGLLPPDAGTVTIDGLGPPADPRVRARIGVAPQALALYDVLSGEENVRFFGEMYGLSGRRSTSGCGTAWRSSVSAIARGIVSRATRGG
jgi:ABC-2 type transport system ATP-binding protein